VSAFFRLVFLALAAVALFTAVLAIAGAPVPRLVTAAMAFYAALASLSQWQESWKQGTGPGSEEVPAEKARLEEGR
jgi:hypothetical protein